MITLVIGSNGQIDKTLNLITKENTQIDKRPKFVITNKKSMMDVFNLEITAKDSSLKKFLRKI